MLERGLPPISGSMGDETVVSRRVSWLFRVEPDGPRTRVGRASGYRRDMKPNLVSGIALVLVQRIYPP